MRLYFDPDGIDIDKVSSVKVYMSSSKDGVYSLIATEPFDPIYDYVEVSDTINPLLKWFKLSLTDKQGTETDRSDAFVSEALLRILVSVKKSIGDAGGAFSDDEYITKVKEALQVHLGTQIIESISEGDIGFVIQLVMISCCYDLAYDNSRYTKITLPDGISLDKGERVQHYLDVAAAMQKRYDSLRGYSQSSGGDVVQGTITKRSFFNRSF